MDFDPAIKETIKQKREVFTPLVFFSGTGVNATIAACCKVAIQTQPH